MSREKESLKKRGIQKDEVTVSYLLSFNYLRYKARYIGHSVRIEFTRNYLLV